jgi:hypothetical protein
MFPGLAGPSLLTTIVFLPRAAQRISDGQGVPLADADPGAVAKGEERPAGIVPLNPTLPAVS